jgi:UDP-N-acetylglucosamine:LPS N-acetylglucosamine transferase
VGLAAGALRIPLVITEADSHLGVTNRVLAPLARRVFLSFPITGRDDGKYEVTGRPLPEGTGSGERAAARRRFGLPVDGPCLLVFGGSLGARRLNHAAVEAFGEAAPCLVLHASGSRDHRELRRRLGGAFTTEELADLYDLGTGWTTDIAAAAAPDEPFAWDARIVGDAAFARYLRGATDFAGGRRRFS